jgi:hypothetical protein
LVKEELKKCREMLEKAAEGVDQDPVMVVGRTTEDYYCQLMVDPKVPAQIMLRWDYPLYYALEEEWPQGMWDELARAFGLQDVESVDL